MRQLLAAVVCTLGLAWPAFAHELPDNRATLVLRDRTHLSVTLFVNYAQALHQALAPRQKFEEFLLMRAAMSPPAFQQELAQVQAKFEAATRVTLPSGRQAELVRWTWPSAASVQYALRQRAMQTVVAQRGHDHDHEDDHDHDHDAGHGDLVEVRAEARLSQETDSLRVQFPEAFNKVMVVSYRPSQVWVEAKTASGAIRF